MPLFFQKKINENTKLGVWKITEEEAFFRSRVDLQRHVSHPQKRLQHLAGRFLLKQLFPDFPVQLIQIADTRKPFLPDEAYHFSISHCGPFAAAIASTTERVGIDIEIPAAKVLRILAKFLHPHELQLLQHKIDPREATVLWSAKEAMFKWWGRGGVDFSEMLRLNPAPLETEGSLQARFIRSELEVPLSVHYRQFEELILSWLSTDANLIHT